MSPAVKLRWSTKWVVNRNEQRRARRDRLTDQRSTQLHFQGGG